MAARRLILAMLVLLVLASAIAAMIPAGRDAADEPSTATAPEAPADAQAGELVEAKLRAQASKPKRISAHEDDQLALTVASSRPGEVEIAPLGVLEPVDGFKPVHIDLLLLERGTYPVRLLAPNPSGTRPRVIGTIEVTRAKDTGGSAKADAGGS